MNNNLKVIIKGSVIAILITVVSLLILSLILSYTNLNDKFTNPIIILVMAISIFIGSIVCSRKINKRGIINGGIVGFIYIVSIYILSSIILKDFSLNLYSLIAIMISIGAGMVGGVIGVNM